MSQWQNQKVDSHRTPPSSCYLPHNHPRLTTTFRELLLPLEFLEAHTSLWYCTILWQSNLLNHNVILSSVLGPEDPMLFSLWNRAGERSHLQVVALPEIRRCFCIQHTGSTYSLPSIPQSPLGPSFSLTNLQEHRNQPQSLWISTSRDTKSGICRGRWRKWEGPGAVTSLRETAFPTRRSINSLRGAQWALGDATRIHSLRHCRSNGKIDDIHK